MDTGVSLDLKWSEREREREREKRDLTVEETRMEHSGAAER